MLLWLFHSDTLLHVCNTLELYPVKLEHDTGQLHRNSGHLHLLPLKVAVLPGLWLKFPCVCPRHLLWEMQHVLQRLHGNPTVPSEVA